MFHPDVCSAGCEDEGLVAAQSKRELMPSVRCFVGWELDRLRVRGLFGRMRMAKRVRASRPGADSWMLPSLERAIGHDRFPAHNDIPRRSSCEGGGEVAKEIGVMRIAEGQASACLCSVVNLHGVARWGVSNLP